MGFWVVGDRFGKPQTKPPHPKPHLIEKNNNEKMEEKYSAGAGPPVRGTSWPGPPLSKKKTELSGLETEAGGAALQEGSKQTY